MELFRRQGYEGTSMTELQEAMGIGRQSLYDTFGDKKQLFVRALERYSVLGRETVAARLFAPGASLPELREYFDELTRFLTPRDGSGGCLLAGAIVELGREDSEVTECCQGNQRAMRAAMRKLLERARSSGEIHKDVDCETASMLLMGQAYGMTVLARNGATRNQLRRTVEQLLDGFTT
jgi:TetR/AcrR family transcriptional regulator, transcriptional repressor for nem operon